jgi:hypothetical protein
MFHLRLWTYEVEPADKLFMLALNAFLKYKFALNISCFGYDGVRVKY